MGLWTKRRCWTYSKDAKFAGISAANEVPLLPFLRRAFRQRVWKLYTTLTPRNTPDAGPQESEYTCALLLKKARTSGPAAPVDV